MADQSNSIPLSKMDTIKSVNKALLVMEELKLKGIISINDLNSSLKMPKPTIVRIIKTLVEAGYVRQLSSRGKYCFTSKIYDLGQSYNNIARIFEVAISVSDALTTDILWPVSIATMEKGEIIVRYSTIPKSPYAHANSTVSKRLPICTSAHGKQWITYTKPEKIDKILDKYNIDTREKPALDQQELIRRKGYSQRSYGRDPSTSTIAAPILINNEIVASMGLTFFVKSLKAQQIDSLAEKLKRAASKISKILNQD